MVVAALYPGVMNHSTNPAEMYSVATVLTASLVVTVAAVALALAVLAPSAALVAGAGLVVASTGRRFYGRRRRRAQNAHAHTTGFQAEA